MATKTKEQILNQAISDFDKIEDALKDSGVDVPYDTDTSEYGNLVRKAVALAGGGSNLVGDNASIVIEDGVVKLIGFEAAEVGAIPQKTADGTLAWLIPSGTDELQALVTQLQSNVETLQTDLESLTERVEDAELGGEENIIEIVKLNGVPLIVSEKAVNIPIAGETLGVVKSAKGENKVTVDENGEMEVKSVNINTLVQTDGDELILIGGSSKINN